MDSLFDELSEDRPEDVKRLTEAGWMKVSYYGQLAWKAPDGRVTTYTRTAIQWLDEGSAGPRRQSGSD